MSCAFGAAVALKVGSSNPLSVQDVEVTGEGLAFQSEQSAARGGAANAEGRERCWCRQRLHEFARRSRRAQNPRGVGYGRFFDWGIGSIAAAVGHLVFAEPNVRVKRATTGGRQAWAGENAPRTAGPGLAACRWRSA